MLALDIAKEAEVSPALIYIHFTNQQDLYMVALKIEADKLMEEMLSYTSLQQLTKKYIQYMYANEILYKMMAYFMLESRNEKDSAPIYEETTRIIELFESVLSPYVSENIRNEAQLLSATLNGLLISYKNYPTFTKDESLTHIIQLASQYLLRFQKNEAETKVALSLKKDLRQNKHAKTH